MNNDNKVKINNHGNISSLSFALNPKPEIISDTILDQLPKPSNIFEQDDPILSTIGKTNYKYAEDRILSEFQEIVDKTYSGHYKTENGNVDCFDAWISLGDATTTFRDTAIKYLWRYGKKEGNNRQDLYKAMHYIMLCIYNDHYKEGIKNGN
jgi:hypothetical protein